jgi:hypothetical protein
MQVEACHADRRLLPRSHAPNRTCLMTWRPLFHACRVWRSRNIARQECMWLPVAWHQQCARWVLAHIHLICSLSLVGRQAMLQALVQHWQHVRHCCCNTLGSSGAPAMHSLTQVVVSREMVPAHRITSHRISHHVSWSHNYKGCVCAACRHASTPLTGVGRHMASWCASSRGWKRQQPCQLPPPGLLPTAASRGCQVSVQ